MLCVLNGILGSGKTHLANRLSDQYHIVDEDNELIKKALETPDLIDRQSVFAHLQIEKLTRVLELRKRFPDDVIIYVGSVDYSTRLYWPNDWRDTNKKMWLKFDRVVRQNQALEKVLLKLCGKNIIEIRLMPSCELIVEQCIKRDRKDAFVPTIPYIQKLRQRENDIPSWPNFFSLDNNNDDISYFQSLFSACYLPSRSLDDYFLPPSELEKFIQDSSITGHYQLIELRLKQINLIINTKIRNEKHISLKKMNFSDIKNSLRICVPLCPWFLDNNLKQITNVLAYFMSTQSGFEAEFVNLYQHLNLQDAFLGYWRFKIDESTVILDLQSEEIGSIQCVHNDYQKFNSDYFILILGRPVIKNDYLHAQFQVFDGEVLEQYLFSLGPTKDLTFSSWSMF